MSESLRPSTGEKISEARQKLFELEKSGKYVFHGSKSEMEILEPQQAMDDVRGPDGHPAVFASRYADQAIFMAVASAPGYTEMSSREHSDRTIEFNFGMTKEVRDRISDKTKAFVYVFPKEAFIPHNDSQVENKTYLEIRPILKVAVSKSDLPKNIKIIEDPHENVEM